MSILKRVWERWKPIAAKIGRFNTRLILTIVYGILLLPFNLAIRVLRKDLLRKKLRSKSSFWLPAERQEATDDPLTAHRRQF